MIERLRDHQAAKYLGVGKSTVWLYAKQGKLHPIKLSDRVTVFTKEDLDAFISGQKDTKDYTVQHDNKDDVIFFDVEKHEDHELMAVFIDISEELQNRGMEYELLIEAVQPIVAEEMSDEDIYLLGFKHGLAANNSVDKDLKEVKKRDTSINRLTEDFIEKTKGGKTRKRYYDGGGMHLEVYPSGTKTFVMKYTVNQKDVYVKLGRYPATTLEEARKMAKKIKGKK